MEFVEAPAFTRNLPNYLTDDAYRNLQASLIANPNLGDVIPGTGGFRKMRWADVRRGKGRRSGLRIIYYHFPAEDRIWLMTVYDKNEAADMTPSQKKALKGAVEAELRTRTSRHASAKRSRRIQ